MAGRTREKAFPRNRMKLREALALAVERLQRAGIEEAQPECEQMLMQLLGVSRAHFYMNAAQEMTPAAEKQFFGWISQREKRIPLAYLLGDVFFYSLKLKVRSGCLIPRPETELLVEKTVGALQKSGVRNPQIADIGTGSGAIGLALLSALPGSKAFLVDFSPEALEIARENAIATGLLERTHFLFSDLFSNISAHVPSGGFDAILSNPPYVTEADMQSLQPEVANEPRMALAGGVDGLDFYRRIIPEARQFLKTNGWLGLEIGFGQAAAVRNELEQKGYQDIQIFKDHQDIERTILARKS